MLFSLYIVDKIVMLKKFKIYTHSRDKLQFFISLKNYENAKAASETTHLPTLASS